MLTLSVIVPCYNEAQALPLFMKEISKVQNKMQDLKFEFIIVDDGSSDQTYSIVKFMAKENESIKYISFSRNFGKEAALLAGLENSNGDYIVVMDADLQDPPSLLPEMYRVITNEKYECVGTRRVTRKGEPLIRSFFARCFYMMINKISKTEIVDGARDFRLMTRKFVNALLCLKEYNRFSKGIFEWVGFDTKWLEYENVERVAGETKWSFWKLFKYSIEGVVAFSTAPLAIASLFGIICCAFAFILAIYYATKALILGDPVVGFPTLICIILLVGGLQLFCLGIVGQYLAKTYMETKQRPIYITKDTNIEIPQKNI